MPGDPEFGYRTVQIPTPEPTSLLLVLAGAALAGRRSRRSV
ncbi:MAG: PEP-CTERM sorting domain-containing protein [Planctomycetes bacterium]|nr:PEP-CTERM sorting domain-containing protein [Planctomycetota bacterium]